MPQIWRLDFTVRRDGALVDLDADPQLSSDPAHYGVKNTATDVHLIDDDTTMTRLSEGRYYYDIVLAAVEAPPVAAFSTNYTYSVEWTLGGVTDFSVLTYTTEAERVAASLTPLYADLVLAITDAFPDCTDSGKQDRIIKSAYTMLLYPPEVMVEGRRIGGYKWNWMSPLDSFNTVVEYKTGTVEAVLGDVEITLTGGTWPDWVADGATLIITDALGADHSFTVSERTGADTLDLTSAWDHADEDTMSYEIHYHPDYYELPAAFGGLVGERMWIMSTIYYPPLLVRTFEQIAPYALAVQTPGIPRYAAIVPAEYVAATGQRYQVDLWPTPDTDYAIGYQYNVNLDAVAAGEYPAGGPQCAQAMKACCKAQAELLQAGGAAGHYYQLALQELASAIAHDMGMRPNNAGPMRDGSDDVLLYNPAGLLTYYAGTTP